MKFAAVAGHRFGRATPSLRDAPQRQSMERIGRESIYRDRNAVQTKPATCPHVSTRCPLLHFHYGHTFREVRVWQSGKPKISMTGAAPIPRSRG